MKGFGVSICFPVGFTIFINDIKISSFTVPGKNLPILEKNFSKK